MTTTDLAAIRKALEAFDRAEWDEVHLVTPEFELHLVAAGAAVADLPALRPPPDESAGRPVEPAAVSATAPAAEPARPVAAHDDRALPVTSPSLGIFWAAPSPGAPPFVAVGDQVEEGDTLCIIEVMKLMNHLKAPFAGRVAAVLVGNGDTVEAGDPIVMIVPDEVPS